jgi:hypothetical protein
LLGDRLGGLVIPDESKSLAAEELVHPARVTPNEPAQTFHAPTLRGGRVVAGGRDATPDGPCE